MDYLSDEEKKKAWALIEEITAAFDGVSREDGITWCEAGVIENYGGPEERAEARACDTEERWQDVPEEEFNSAQFVVLYLDPLGFRYYLPAFLIWYLRRVNQREPHYPNVFTPFDRLLTGGWDEVVDEFYLEKFNFLTSAQARSVAHYLEFRAGREDSLMEKHIAQDQIRGEKEQTRLRSEFERGALSQEEFEYAMEDIYIEDGELWTNYCRIALDRYWGQFLDHIGDSSVIPPS
jgi:hypothetical protein